MNRTLTITTVLAILFWTAAVGLCIAGSVVALEDTEDAYNRTLGAVLLGLGMLHVAVAMMLSAKVLADRRTQRVVDVVTAVDKIDRARSR